MKLMPKAFTNLSRQSISLNNNTLLTDRANHLGQGITNTRSVIPQLIPAMTGIRGIAALWVVALHFGEEFETLLPQWRSLAFLYKRGHEGVPLFYIMSGFILAHVYNSTNFRLNFSNYKIFIKHRVFRIYPLHLVTLLILGALVLAAYVLSLSITGDYRLDSFFYNLFLLQSFPFVNGSGWNYPSWTISVEWFSYLFAFPLGYLLISLIKPPIARILVSFLFIVGALWVQTLMFFPNSATILNGFLLFLAGMFLQSFAAAQRSFSVYGWIGLTVVVTDILLFYFTPDYICRSAFVLLSPFVILACLATSSLFSAIFSLPAIVFLGDISYSLYMTHAIAEKLLKIVLPVTSFAGAALSVRVGIIGIYVLSIGVGAVAAYYIVERPTRVWLKKKYG